MPPYKHFIEKTEDTRSSIQLPDHDPSAPSTRSAVLNHFEPVTLTTLVEIVEHLKPTACPQDIIPARIFNAHVQLSTEIILYYQFLH